MIKIEYPIVREFPGKKALEIIEKSERLFDALTQDVENMPLIVDRGEGTFVYDVDGNKFLDFSSAFAVVSLGHGNRKVIEAIKSQAERLTHFPLADFYLENGVLVAQKLVNVTKGNFDKKVVFANSGAEANEVMMKLVKYATKRKRFIAFYGAFHGRTHATLSLTASKPIQQLSYFPTVPGIVHAPYPNPYRNPFKIDGYEKPDELINAVISFIEDYIFKHVPPEEVGAIVFEPIQGEGGYVVPPKNFFKELKRLADKYGILLADDEVQMGMGRTGEFWAIENFEVQPDILQFGKAIANGLPLGGIIHRADISFDKTGLHSSTFGGNVIALAAANVVIDETLSLLQDVKKKGQYLGKYLNEMKDKYEQVGDVRGIGLAWGVEFVSSKSSKRPEPVLRNKVIKNALRMGLVIIGCGESSIRVIPPLTVSYEEIDIAMDILNKAIKGSI